MTINNHIEQKIQSVHGQHQLYQKDMLLHHKNPIGFNRIIKFSHHSDGYNAACGDEITIQIEVKSADVFAIAFLGDSCAICRASASLLCENIEGLSIEIAQQLCQQIIVSIKDNVAMIGELAEKFSPLLSVQKFPVRKQCALLPWQTAQHLFTGITAKEK